MSDRKKTSKEIQAEIDALADQLAATLRLEVADLTRQVEEREAKCQALLRKMVGCRIVITKEDDALCGMEAVVRGPRGKSKKPMHWWFQTTTGIKACEAKTSFRLLPVDNAPRESMQSALPWQTELGCQQESSCCRLWQPQHVPAPDCSVATASID